MLKRYTAALLCGALALTSALSPVFAAGLVINPYAFGGAGANATSYPGTGYGTHADNTNISATKLITLSFWVKRDLSSPDAAENVFAVATEGTNGVGIVRVILSNGGALDAMMSIQGFPAAGATPIVQGRSTAYLFDNTDWHHVLYSVDASNTGKRHFYVDDVDISPTWVQYTNDTFAVRGTFNRVGAAGLTVVDQEYWGSLSEVYVDLGTYTDFSVEANRRLFIDASLKPADLRSDGSGPTGASPEIYLPEGDPKDNRGTTADYAITGTLTPAEGPNP